MPRTSSRKYAEAETALAVPAGFLTLGNDLVFALFTSTAGMIHSSSVFEQDKVRDHTTFSAKMAALRTEASKTDPNSFIRLDRNLDIIEITSERVFLRQGWKPLATPFRFMRNMKPVVKCRTSPDMSLSIRGTPTSDVLSFYRGKIYEVEKGMWMVADDCFLSQIFHGLAVALQHETAADKLMEHLVPLIKQIESEADCSREGVIDFLLAHEFLMSDFEDLPADPRILAFELVGMRNEHRQDITLTAGTRAYWKATRHPPLWQSARDIPAENMEEYMASVAEISPQALTPMKDPAYVGLEVSLPGGAEARDQVLAWLEGEHHLLGTLVYNDGAIRVQLYESDRYFILTNDVFGSLLGLLTWDKPLQ